jgi:hypothetical protein
MGQLDNTIVVFTTDNGAEAISFPHGGITPFKGQKGEAWEGGYRAPLVVRWPGHIKPGAVKNQLFAALDWVPTLVDIAGGPKGDGLKTQIEAGSYPGIVKTTLDGFDRRGYLEGTAEKSARDFFFYFSGSTPSAVRYKNWKMYYTMSQPGPAGWILPLIPFHFTMVQNIKRDPFEQSSTVRSRVRAQRHRQPLHDVCPARRLAPSQSYRSPYRRELRARLERIGRSLHGKRGHSTKPFRPPKLGGWSSASNGTTLQSTAVGSTWRSPNSGCFRPSASTAGFPTNRHSSRKSPHGSRTAMPTTPRPTGNSQPKMLVSNSSIFTHHSE